MVKQLDKGADTSKKGDKKEALKFAQKAKELGDKSNGFFFKSQVENALEDWKKK